MNRAGRVNEAGEARPATGGELSRRTGGYGSGCFGSWRLNKSCQGASGSVRDANQVISNLYVTIAGGMLLAYGAGQKEHTMSLFITIVALASLLPVLYAAYGAIEDRVQHNRLSRGIGRAFSK